jgi:hypothetical protein
MKNLVHLALAFGILGAAACSDADDDAMLLRRGTNSQADSGAESDDSPSQTLPARDSGTAPGITTDGGTTASDGNADSGVPPAANAFTGAPAYVATSGGSTSKGAHGNGGNPAKRDCMTSDCHGSGGPGPRFAAGGTIYTSAAATTPAAQVEVRFVDADGTAVSKYTNATGNFYLRATDAANLAFPLKVAVRDAKTTQPMVATIANGACSSAACHGAAATGVVHVP